MIDYNDDYSRIYETLKYVDGNNIKEISLLDLQMMVLQQKDRIKMILRERRELRARLKYIEIDDSTFPKIEIVKRDKFYADPHRELSSQVKKQDLASVKNISTPFYNKKIIISGIFERFPFRNDLAKLLKNYGADINESISSKTNIFIFGNDYGPVKMEKAQCYVTNGANLEILSERKLYEILDSLT